MAPTTHRSHVQPRAAASGSLRTSRSPRGPKSPVPRSTAIPALIAGPPVIAPLSVPVYAVPGLSDREVAVLKVWLCCDSKLDVAERLHIAIGTVNTHLSRIRDKYTRVGRPAPTKAALVARALQDGIVTLDDL